MLGYHIDTVGSFPTTLAVSSKDTATNGRSSCQFLSFEAKVYDALKTCCLKVRSVVVFRLMRSEYLTSKVMVMVEEVMLGNLLVQRTDENGLCDLAKNT